MLPPGGVKKMAPPAPAPADGEGDGDGTGTVAMPGSVGCGAGTAVTAGFADGEAAGGGLAPSIAESVRRSAATALELVTVLLR